MKSMTAFGRGCATVDVSGVIPDTATPETPAGVRREITVEIRSVNNRFLDLSVRLPRAYVALEERVKAVLKAAGISRGKVELTVTMADPRFKPEAGGSVQNITELDADCAARYVEAARKAEQLLGVPNDLTAARLLTLPGVMVPLKDDAATLTEEAVFGMISPVLTAALADFVAARQREGERLGEDLMAKLAGIRQMVATLAARSETNIRTCREHFEERLRAVLDSTGVAVDESRLLTECALYADRVAIDEEVVRLGSHLDTLEGMFRSDSPVGREIDFMIQETNREVNTIGSKCTDADMARTVAGIKNQLEKIREQIQNIE